ncbi:MAG TPA: endolytic transglycosylase MltG [Xanthobacteraceae bacterium]|nr:endolytic transglycosylase MltG [Xanthobacteraceae bacterium]
MADPTFTPAAPSRWARHPLVVAGNAVFTVLLIAIVIGGAVLWVGRIRFDAPGPLPAAANVIIPEQSGLMDIADLLESRGVIRDKWVFIGGALGSRATGKLKAGEYAFAQAASSRDVLAAIVSGRVIEYTVTLPEGLTSEQIVQRLADADVLTGTVRQPPREGALLPATYKVTRGMTRDEVLRRMAREQQRVLKEVWAARAADLPLKSPDELVVLASIVEKETGVPEERARVAAVFVNRLNKRMRLQSDPTIIYGIVRGKGRLDRPLTRTDITTATPFNTYTIDGLPPAPIGNPGRAALEAVANPAKTRDVYFVADGTGGHAFAETLDQHNKNVTRWRQIEKDKAAADAAATAAPAAAPAVPAPAAGTTAAPTGVN